MARGIDASMDCTPYLDNLRNLGVTFVARYYTNLQRTTVPTKVLTPREAHVLSEQGFDIVVVWELLASPGYFTLSQGQADGTYAYRYANEAIHQPENSTIYFAVDFDCSEQQFVQCIKPYFEGVQTAFNSLSGDQPLYSVGVYGSGAVCAALKQLNLARYSWLASAGRWQGSPNYQDWDLKQGPRLVHPPFEFDEDIAKDQFGAFRVRTNENVEKFFSMEQALATSPKESSLRKSSRRTSPAKSKLKRKAKKTRRLTSL